MIDTRTRERLEYDMEEAIRGYMKSKVRKQQIKDEAIEAIRKLDTGSGIVVTDILNQMNLDLEDCEGNMEIWEAQLTDAKKQYIKLIERINFPEY